MPVRRAADPISVQHIWDAIRSANAQRQMADVQRISRYLQKIDNCTPTQAELYIKQTVEDGLIVAIQKVSARSTTAGEHVESYRIPLQEIVSPDDGKDWYCIECHLAGDVIPCRSCFRVFHEECSSNISEKKEKRNSRNSNGQNVYNGEYDVSIQLKECHVVLNNNINAKNLDVEEKVLEQPILTNEVSSSRSECSNRSSVNIGRYDKSLCSICNVSNSETDFALEKDELNHLLYFILERIRSWIPENITTTMSQGTNIKLEWHTESEFSWRAKQLFYEHMDMPVMDVKIRSQEYTRLCEFQADVLTVQHNIAIFHGIESQEYAAAELMLKDCLYDMMELKNCVDCYKHSNEKINNKWFCLPCRIPHKLVWAKQKGYPYWPAKVIKETDTNCDVRFFGGKYERSVLPKNCIKPITVKLQTLQIKRSSAFNRAYDELMFHQKLLNNPDEVEKFLANKKNRKPQVRRDSAVKNIDVKMKSLTKSKPKPKDIYEFKESQFESDSKFFFRPENPSNKRKRSTSPSSKNLTKTSENSFKRSSTRLTRSVLNLTGTDALSDVINISDAEESEGFSDDKEEEEDFMRSFDASHELVSSSTEYVRTPKNNFRENSDNSMHQLEQPYNDSVEKMRRKLEQCKNKRQLIKLAMDCMQTEIDKITNEHNEQLRKMFDSHNTQISETKKKQWCYNCEQDAIYHCCWNTAYCSQTCQQQHWQAEHKKVCRRKR